MPAPRSARPARRGPGGIVFGANMTTLNFALTRTLAREWRPGDEIVGTRLDHDANVTPWQLAADERGVRLRLAPFDVAPGRLDPEAVTSLIGPRTRWVAITGASNALGHHARRLAPVVEAAHASGARVLVDGVHLVPHRPVDHRRARGSTPSSPRPTSGTARTPECCGWRRTSASRSSRTRSGRRPTPRRSGSRPARPRSRPSPGSAPQPHFSARSAWSGSRSTRRRCFGPLLDGLLGHAPRRGPRAPATRPTGRRRCASASRTGLPTTSPRDSRPTASPLWSGDYYAVETMARARARRPGRAPGGGLLLHLSRRRRAPAHLGRTARPLIGPRVPGSLPRSGHHTRDRLDRLRVPRRLDRPRRRARARGRGRRRGGVAASCRPGRGRARPGAAGRAGPSRGDPEEHRAPRDPHAVPAQRARGRAPHRTPS